MRVNNSCGSIVDHRQCGPPVSGLQLKKQHARFLDVSLRTTLGCHLQGNSSRMIRAADESQSLGQASHGCTVDRCLFHLIHPCDVIQAPAASLIRGSLSGLTQFSKAGSSRSPAASPSASLPSAIIFSTCPRQCCGPSAASGCLPLWFHKFAWPRAEAMRRTHRQFSGPPGPASPGLQRTRNTKRLSYSHPLLPPAAASQLGGKHRQVQLPARSGGIMPDCRRCVVG
jgi:hypothetical protein